MQQGHVRQLGDQYNSNISWRRGRAEIKFYPENIDIHYPVSTKYPLSSLALTDDQIMSSVQWMKKIK